MDQYKITICPEPEKVTRSYSYLTEHLEDDVWEYYDNNSQYYNKYDCTTDAFNNLPDGDKQIFFYDNTEE